MAFKLGAIPTDICRQDFARSLSLMKRDGLMYADVESVYGKIPGTHTDEEHMRIKETLDQYGIKTQVVGGFSFRNQSLWSIDVGDEAYRRTLDELARQIELAKLLDCGMITIMMVLPGVLKAGLPVGRRRCGASQWLQQ